MGLADFFTQQFERKGGAVSGREAYMAKDMDFKPILTKILAQNPDIIFIPGYYQEVGLIIRQAREMGASMPILGGDGWDSDKLVEIASPQNLQNTYFCNHYSQDDNNPALQEFIRKYEARYGYKPDSFAVTAYDSANLMMEAIERAGSTKAEAVSGELTKIRDFPGISGQITIDDKHNTVSSGIIMKFSGGKREFVERIDPV
jgi:branched-chain amino acid transport system substrate-binding protein